MESPSAANTTVAKGLEVLGWAVAAFMLTSCIRVLQPPPLANDSYQYLNVAENLKRGRGIATSLVYFDTERSHGRIPAPLTTFPPGYSVVLAVASFGGNLEALSRVLSGVCFAGSAALLAWGLMLAGASPLLRQACLLLFVTNIHAIRAAASVMTEPLFTLLSTATVVMLISAENTPPGRCTVVRTTAGYLLAGLACWVRYAGYFLVAAIAVHALLQFLVKKRASFLISALAPISLAVALMLRNWAIVGSWRGGNELLIDRGVRWMLVEYPRSQLHLWLGAHRTMFGVWEVLLIVGALATAGTLAAGFRKGALTGGTRPDGQVLLIALCVLLYTGGIVYAGLRTPISFNPRMFLPILPLYLLLAGAGATWAAAAGNWHLPVGRSRRVVVLLLLSLGYAGVNARDLYRSTEPSPHEALAGLYDLPSTYPNQPLMRWVESNIPPASTIVAEDGQATGYLLRRPTLSLVDAEYSPVRWDCKRVRDEMLRFRADWLILYKSSLNSRRSLLNESPFLAAAASQRPPCGFTVAAENSAVRILKREPRNNSF